MCIGYSASRVIVLTLASLLAVSPIKAHAQPNGEQDAFVPVSDAMLQDPAPSDWLMWRRTLDGCSARSHR